MAMIEFNHADRYYGKSHALKNINLEFGKGGVVVVIGLSGPGKNTALRCINGLETISSDKLSINDVGLRDKKTKLTEVRRSIDMVLQHFNLHPNKIVLENIKLVPIKVLKQDQATVVKSAEKSLKTVNMLDEKDPYPSILSGGQQQRIAITRGLVMNPEILLSDGPTSALGPEMIGNVLDVMKKLTHDGTSVIVVAHEMGSARKVADRVVLMAGGEVLEDGRNVRDLFEDPNEVRAQ